jgi:SAM-dependent methyltransferase
MSQPTERFTSRVENYAKFRPGYPAQIVDLLIKECGLRRDSVVADVGSGTGKLSELFLENGNAVIGVEPNEAMRAAAESLLKRYPQFASINGTAEATTLASSSADLVVAGQAFHWFDPQLAKTECIRILKPEGWVVLIWNERKIDTTPFLRDYEEFLLTYGTDYPVVRQENATAAIDAFFAPNAPRTATFPNNQVFDFDALKGRLFSTSYTPEPGHPQFEPMLHRLNELFEKHQKLGRVVFEYDTKLFYGQLDVIGRPDSE